MIFSEKEEGIKRIPNCLLVRFSTEGFNFHLLLIRMAVVPTALEEGL